MVCLVVGSEGERRFQPEIDVSERLKLVLVCARGVKLYGAVWGERLN